MRRKKVTRIVERATCGEGGEWITKEVLTAEDLARYLGFNKNWVYRKAEAGEIPGTKLGRSWRFKRSAIDRWLEEGIEKERVIAPSSAEVSVKGREVEPVPPPQLQPQPEAEERAKPRPRRRRGRRATRARGRGVS